MNMALKIHKALKEEIDLKSIKKVIAVYEKLRNEDDDDMNIYSYLFRQ
jgi:hypothetical protein